MSGISLSDSRFLLYPGASRMNLAHTEWCKTCGSALIYGDGDTLCSACAELLRCKKCSQELPPLNVFDCAMPSNMCSDCYAIELNEAV